MIAQIEVKNNFQEFIKVYLKIFISLFLGGFIVFYIISFHYFSFSFDPESSYNAVTMIAPFLSDDPNFFWFEIHFFWFALYCCLIFFFSNILIYSRIIYTNKRLLTKQENKFFRYKISILSMVIENIVFWFCFALSLLIESTPLQAEGMGGIALLVLLAALIPFLGIAALNFFINLQLSNISRKISEYLAPRFFKLSTQDIEKNKTC